MFLQRFTQKIIVKVCLQNVKSIGQNFVFADIMLSCPFIFSKYSCLTSNSSSKEDEYKAQELRKLFVAQNFDLLVDSFRNSILINGNSKQARNSRFQYERLSKLIEKIKKENEGNRPLVVDGLNIAISFSRLGNPCSNLVSSVTEQIDLELFRELLRNLQNTYCPILVIFKHRLMDGFVQKLKQINVYHSVCLESYKTKDDLFIINAALMLGPEAHILSNDRYLDHRRDFLKDDFALKLFDEWSKSNFVRFSRVGPEFPCNSTEGQ